MAEQADATDLKSVDLMIVRVRFPLKPLIERSNTMKEIIVQTVCKTIRVETWAIKAEDDIHVKEIITQIINDPDKLFQQDYQLIDSEDIDNEDFVIERIDINNA